MFVSAKKDRAIVFNYVVSNRFEISFSISPIKLQGLDPQKKYRLTEINVFPGAKSSINSNAVYSGDYLMTVGFNPDLSLGRTSVLVEVKEVL